MTPKRLGRRTVGRVFPTVVVAAFAATVAGVIPTAPAPAMTLPGAPVIVQAFAGPSLGAVHVAWGKANAGGGVITTYGFSVSVDGGTTWSALRSFGSTGLFQATATFPSFVCTNSAPGSKGCLFRIYASNALGFGLPSKPVALWTAPSAPRSLQADADFDFTTTALTWNVPAVDGGLTITGYDVFGSMDGATAQLLTTVSAIHASVPCSAKRTCAYSVRAINSHGKSPFSVVTVSPAPGPPQDLTLQNAGSDPATGRSVLHFAWKVPLTGLAADHYDVHICGLSVGVPTSCAASSASWTEVTQVFPATGGSLTANGTCQASFATCFMRVRAVNVRDGEGPWRAIDLEPWAPYSLTVTAGPARGSVIVHFRGPGESGSSGTAAKHYRVLVCDTICNVSSNWKTVSDAVPYPPAGAAPYLAGWFACRRPPTTRAPQPRQCRVRMQFVDGLGNAGILSRVASGPEHP